MLSLLKLLFGGTASKQAKNKRFKFMVCNDKSEAPLNTWYRLRKWRNPNFLLMKTTYSKDWKIFNARTSLNGEEEVMGTFKDNREETFLNIGDRSGFKIYLERERDNPVDPNAIKVMGSSIINEKIIGKHLGYIAKEKAAMLKDEVELDARPYSVYIPSRDKSLMLNIRVLVRSGRYKKKNKD